MHKTRVIQVIETYERRGLGRDGDPIRAIQQFWSFDGELLMEEPDPYKEETKKSPPTEADGEMLCSQGMEKFNLRKP